MLAKKKKYIGSDTYISLLVVVSVVTTVKSTVVQFNYCIYLNLIKA